MKKRNLLELFLVFAVIGMVFSSFKKDDVEPEEKKGEVEYHDLGGFYITNEGQFGKGNGSISFYNSEKDVVFNDVFKEKNGRIIGDVVQSIAIVGQKAVICVNASNKIIITKAIDMEQVSEIVVSKPRYAIQINDTIAYVSSWSNKVFVVNVNQGKVVKEIAVGNSPERMKKVGDKVFVANSGNDYNVGGDKTISVININSLMVEKTISSEYFCPVAFASESENYIWALYQGKVKGYDVNWQPTGHEPSYAIKIDVAAGTIVKSVKLFDDKHPANLVINNEKTELILGSGYGFVGLYKLPTSTEVISKSPFINNDFYGFDLNPKTGNIIGFVSVSPGDTKMIRYKADGTMIKDYQVGYYGNGAAFKKRSN